jgi:four helix bundle protein
MDLALALAKAVRKLRFPRGYAHLRDQLWRASDHAVLRLEEGCCRTAGNRYQHLQGAYAEAREAQRALGLMQQLGLPLPSETVALAERLGGLLYGLMRRYRQP